MPNPFTIVHLSDLHFSPGSFIGGSHQHSIPRLLGVEAVLNGRSVDRLIVSGDITNDGGTESLLRAATWLFSSFPVSGDIQAGLNLPVERVGIVPGNHDAFNENAGGNAKLLDCWQKSLDNYNTIFPHHAYHPNEPGNSCRWDWLQKDGRAIFIVYVDTCYLGDPELEDRRDYRHALSRIPRVARGRFHRKQSETILAWFQLGIRGKLSNPSAPSQCIRAEDFASSLKILVAHHYLFEPAGYRIESLLHVSQVRAIFCNLASADFDMYLCGHKHISDWSASTYGTRLTRRGKSRHLLNLFRRMLNIDMMPSRLRDDEGKPISAVQTLLLTLMYLKEKISSSAQAELDPGDGKFIEDFVAALQRALQEPAVLEKELVNFLGQYRLPKDDVLHADELAEIQRRLSAQFSHAERVALDALARRIGRLARELSSRPFLHIMAGSAAKEPGRADKTRSFNIYTIEPDQLGYGVQCERFTWDPSLSKFAAPQKFFHRFDDSRRAVLSEDFSR